MDYLFDFSKYFWLAASASLIIIYYKRKELKLDLLKKLVISWPIITFIQLALNNSLTYFSWKNNRYFRHLLPPESNYLFDNIKNYDLPSYLMTAGIAVVIGLVLLFVSRKSQEKVLTMNEVLLVFLGCLIVGWSNVIFFLAGAVVFNVLGYLGLMLFKKIKPGEILFFTPFIILAIIFTLIYGYKLSYLTGLY